MRRVLALTLVLLVPFPAFAQPKHRVADWKFWVLGVVLPAAAGIADAETLFQSSCFRIRTCGERNPLLGRHPSRARGYAVMAAIHTGFGFATYYLKKLDAPDEYDEASHEWVLEPLMLTGVHMAGIVVNRQVEKKEGCSAHPQLCRR